jgi:hypothetical protein
MLIQELQLRRPIFRKTAAYGHFGREEPEFSWEKTPLVEKLKERAHAGNGHAAAKPAAATGATTKKPAKATVSARA